ncbi:cell division protein FtsQ/DivIB [Candidatus Odyssella thessalonicensis]|uniref:cell division protein FtsQ/DivIB n=1 Tax=Candidatus Odyssella thessalonicensis TaxID=84647 RepID=UPI000225B4A5|nr:cell division protein FtsQ/DivIB [Candidatus Odyssella thessalonicensis]
MPPVKKVKASRHQPAPHRSALGRQVTTFFEFWKSPKRFRGGAEVLKRRLVIAACSAAITTVSYLVLAGYPGVWWTKFSDYLIFKSAKLGLSLNEIYVYGRNHTESQRLLDQIHLVKGDPILKYSPEEIRQNIKKISWVKDVSVQRFLPDTIHISIVERVPIALWQHRQKHYLVDVDGIIISDKNIQQYSHLPVVVGSDAPRHAPQLLTLLDQVPELKKRVSAIVWVGERRWNLLIDRTIEVKLPEKDPEGAIKRLLKLLKNEKLDFSQIKSIDLRQPTQVFIRLTTSAEIQLKGKGIEA